MAIVEQARRVRLKAEELLVEANVLAELNQALIQNIRALIQERRNDLMDDTEVGTERPTRYHGPQS